MHYYLFHIILVIIGGLHCDWMLQTLSHITCRIQYIQSTKYHECFGNWPRYEKYIKSSIKARTIEQFVLSMMLFATFCMCQVTFWTNTQTIMHTVTSDEILTNEINLYWPWENLSKPGTEKGYNRRSCILNNKISVSYTHLDVYKRQVLNSIDKIFI